MWWWWLNLEFGSEVWMVKSRRDVAVCMGFQRPEKAVIDLDRKVITWKCRGTILRQSIGRAKPNVVSARGNSSRPSGNGRICVLWSKTTQTWRTLSPRPPAPIRNSNNFDLDLLTRGVPLYGSEVFGWLDIQFICDCWGNANLFTILVNRLVFTTSINQMIQSPLLLRSQYADVYDSTVATAGSLNVKM